ncbi:hypothetical protein ISN44_As11g021870 [Arabidopsis suecica]|uniref:Nucleoplasmin-like domain-containing protein n=1 Tax=Arabidopsis suecica TaxID=45249 RepID=A0A8T1ZAF5_ARASU|nr:hypothetical protein ISN44_As11g021870 [Arabidopsis suecica]
MEFWGVEVKPGKPTKVTPEDDSLVHISQASLDCKVKSGESVVLTVTVDGTKLVIGTLSQEKFPQISFDLVFEKEFEISHNCTKGTVHFVGYRSPNIDQDDGEDYTSSEEEDVPEAVPAPVPAAVAVNGNAGAAASNVVKADSKPKAKPAEVKPAEVKPESEDDEDSSDEEDESGDDDDSEKGMDVDEDDSDDEEDESEEEEETPKKPEPINKKRPNESTSKTPVSGKKAKPAAAPAATPQKTEEKKKGGHTATPHPAKKGGGKSPVNANQSPKAGGQSSGGNKKFNSGKQFGGSNNKGKGKGRA